MADSKDSKIAVRIGGEDADGICLATVYADQRKVRAFETTQAELREFALVTAGAAVPTETVAAAQAARARRVELGRTGEWDYTNQQAEG